MQTMEFFSETASNISKASSAILEYIKEQNNEVSEDVLFDIRLCLEEALRNAMLHGNKLSPKLKVGISYEIVDDEFIITIQDKGEGFDPASVLNPTDEENLYREHGRGVFIMNELMDSVVYKDQGTLVQMRKKIK